MVKADAGIVFTWDFLIPAGNVLDSIVLNQNIAGRPGRIRIEDEALPSNGRTKSVYQDSVTDGAKS
jgi:hypothetical protein